MNHHPKYYREVPMVMREFHQQASCEFNAAHDQTYAFKRRDQVFALTIDFDKRTVSVAARDYPCLRQHAIDCFSSEAYLETPKSAV